MADRVDLDAVTALCEAATPGPWISYDLSGTQFNSTNNRGWWWVWQESKLPYYGGVMEVRDDGPPTGAVGSANITDNDDGEQEQHDAEFIAQSRSLLPALVAELRDLRAKVDAVRELHKVERLTYVFDGHIEEICDMCCESWPCPTVAALGEVAGRDEDNNTEETS